LIELRGALLLDRRDDRGHPTDQCVGRRQGRKCCASPDDESS
jgi:hypothetical protein